jgi:membrane protease YdiL (CAAX protease family)
MTQAIKTTLFYEAVTLPLKYAIIPYIDQQMPPSNVTTVKDISTGELKNHKCDVLIAVAIGCIAGPILEECVFRGAVPLIITYATGCPGELSLVISAVAFSVLHYWNKKSVSDVMCQFADSYFLYNPLKISGGLTSSIISHAMHNLTQFLPTLKRTFF